MSTDFSFKLNMINSSLQLVANMLAWPLSAYFGRRTIYLVGTATNVAMLFLLGIFGSLHQTSATNYAQACLGVIISFVYALAMGPITYSIIAEASSVRLRALSTGVGRAAYYVAEIPMIYLASRMLNPTGWNMAGKCGYVWGGTARARHSVQPQSSCQEIQVDCYRCHGERVDCSNLLQFYSTKFSLGCWHHRLTM